MSAARLLLVVFVVGVFFGQASAQVTALTINNQSSGLTVVQGDSVTWRITLPAGATSENEIWLDVNADGQITSGTDKSLFTFTQTDGAAGTEGPGDIDGMANGMIVTGLRTGFAPGKWIFKATHNSVGLLATFTVTAFPSPPYSVSGTISAPGGVVRSNIIVEAQPNGGDLLFWHGITDSSGAYAINIGDSTATALNPWRVRSAGDSQSFGAYVLMPRDTMLSLSGHHTGVNFTLLKGTVITGRVTDLDTGVPIESARPHFHDALDPFPPGGGDNQYASNTDAMGFFTFAAPPGKYFLHFTKDGYTDQWWDRKTTSMDTITVTTQDTIANLNGSLRDSLVLSVRRVDGRQPTDFRLDQNYPNPFNPSTVIRFSVPVRSRVDLSVFDALGRRVASLFSGTVDGGSYEQEWTAVVASGVYFYELKAVSVSDPESRFVNVKRMVLTK